MAWFQFGQLVITPKWLQTWFALQTLAHSSSSCGLHISYFQNLKLQYIYMINFYSISKSLNACACGCVCRRVHAAMCASMPASVGASVGASMHASVHVCVHSCVHVCICGCVCGCVRAHGHAHVHPCVRASVHPCICVKDWGLIVFSLVLRTNYEAFNCLWLRNVYERRGRDSVSQGLNTVLVSHSV
jgi:hypothetical protein